MAYVKNNWVDREGTTRYFETVDDDGALIFTPDYTQVTELGTPVNADNMNHIEEGIAAGSFTKYDTKTTYYENDLVTNITGNELKVYKSLKDENTNNNILDTLYWEEVELGGVSLEILNQFVEKDSLVEVQTVIETYVNGASWYRIWSDGWCEQGGYYIPTATTGTINLLKAYKDTNYSITTGSSRTVNDNTYVPVVGVTKTSDSFSIYLPNTAYRAYWQASGYIW